MGRALPELMDHSARVRMSLDGLPLWAVACIERHGHLMPWMRVPCGGRRRRDGKPCEALSVPGRRRCRWHGGMSTGPRTAEGIAKVSRNLPQVAAAIARASTREGLWLRSAVVADAGPSVAIRP